MSLRWWRNLTLKRMNKAIQRAEGQRWARPYIEALETRTMPSANPLRPLLVLPGIGGSFPNNAQDANEWYTTRGISPEKLALDPLGGLYNDMMQTFDNAGYTPGVDLFGAAYDWRMNPGPIDVTSGGAIDGHIDGLTGGNITDTTYQYGVDYLGYWLKQAVEAWHAAHGNVPTSVDIVAHSTGGLVARTYIQSDAYGQQFTATLNNASTTANLPTINNFIMVGVPNRGASGAWNPIHDNFSRDMPTRIALSKMMNRSYELMVGGTPIASPDIAGGQLTTTDAPDHATFIQKYAPTVSGLLATYDFFKTSDNAVPADKNSTGDANTFLLDLNHGLDKDFFVTTAGAPDFNAFAGHVGHAVVVYSDSEKTPTFVTQKTGPDGLLSEVLPFDKLIGHRPASGEGWFKDEKVAGGGDGTVPTESLIGQFANDNRVEKRRITEKRKGETLDHTGILAAVAGQTAILEELAVNFQPSEISTNAAFSAATSMTNIVTLGILTLNDFPQDLVADAITQLQNGLTQLRTFAHNLDQSALMSQTLPLVNQSAGQIISFEQTVNAFATPIENYLSTSPSPSIPELLTVIVGAASDAKGVLLSPSLAGGGVLSAESLVFDVSLDLSKVVNVPLDLGTQAANLGLKLDASANVNVDVRANLDFSFGIDLTGTPPPLERFFIAPQRFALSADVHTTALNAGISVGMLSANVTNGTINLDGDFSVTFNDPNNDGKLTISELQTGIGSLVNVSAPTVTLSASLPVQASVSGSPVGSGTVTLTDNNLLDATAPTLAFTGGGAADLQNFSNLTPASLLGLLDQLGSSLQGFIGSMNVGSIPLLGKIDKALDFVKTLTDLTRELSIVEVTGSAAVANPVLSADAVFTVAINNGTPTEVRVLQTNTQGNADLDALVADINTALTVAGLNTQLIAVRFGDRVRITDNAGTVLSFTIGVASPSDPATTELHLANGQQGTLKPNFGSIDAFALKLAEKLGLPVGNLNLGYNPATNRLSFDLNRSASFSRSVTLGFEQDFPLGPFGTLGLSGGATANIAASATLNFTLGIDLSPLGPGESLANRIFLTPGGGIHGDATIDATGLNLSGAIGNISVGVQNGVIGNQTGVNPFVFNLDFTLQDPNSDGRIHFNELTAGAVSAPTLTASGSAVLPLAIQGITDLLGVSVPVNPQIRIDLNAGTGQAFDVAVSTNGLDSLFQSFKDFSVDDLIGLAFNAIESLRNSNLKQFNDPLPLIGKSVRELLAFTEPILAAFDTVKARIEGLKAFLQSKLTGIGSNAIIDGIQEVLSQTPLLSQLTQPQIDKLNTAIAALSDAIAALPTTINTSAFTLPAKVVSALGALKDALDAIPSTTGGFNELKDIIRQLRDSVPSVQTLVQFVADAIGLRNLLNLSGLQSTVQAKITAAVNALTSAGEAALANTLSGFGTQFSGIVNAPTLDIAGLLGLFDDVKAFAQSLPGTVSAAAQQAVQEALTSFAGNFPGRLHVSFANSVLDVGFEFTLAKSVNDVPLDFSFASNVANFLPVNVETGGVLDVAVSADLALNLGVRVGGSFDVFLRPTSQFALTALVEANDLTGAINIGGVSAITLGPAPNFGSLILKATDIPTDHTPASLTITLDDTNNDNEISLADLPTSLHVDTTGVLAFSAPVEIFNTLLNDPLSVSINLDDFSVDEFTIPDLSSFITNANLDAVLIRLGLDQLKSFAQQLSVAPFMNQPIPLLNKTAAELIDLEQLVTQFVTPIEQFLDNNTGGFSAQQFIAAVTSAANALGSGVFNPTQAPGGGAPGDDALTFDIGLDLNRTFSAPFDLGSGATGFGLKLDGGAAVTVALLGDFNFTFGIDLGGGLSPLERFFVEPTTLHLSADVNAVVNVGVNIGFLHAAVQNGTFGLNTDFVVNVTDPNNDGRITLSELQGTTIGNLVNIPTPTATLDVTLPVAASLGSGAGAFGASATVQIHDANLFTGDAPTFDFTADVGDIQDLLNFNTLSPETLLGLLEQLGGQLQSIVSGLLPPGGIPIIGAGLERALDFIEMLNNFTAQFTHASLTADFPTAFVLTGDAVFDIALDGGAVTTVTVEAADTTGNTSLADLVIDINAALADAGLGTSLKAEINGGKLQLVALTGSIDSFTLATTTADPAHTQLGFSESQESESFSFGNIQEFAQRVFDRLGLPINAQYDAAGDAMTFTLDLGANFNKDVHIGFNDGISLGPLGELCLVGGADVNFDASANLTFTVGIDLRPLASGETLFDRFFLKAGDGITANATISAANINLFAALGNIELGIQGGVIGDLPGGPVTSPFQINAGLTLQDPDNSDGLGRITLAELVSRDANGRLVALPTPSLTAEGTAILPLNIQGIADLFGVTLPSAPVVQIDLSASAIPPSFDISVTTTGLEDLFSSFQDFSLDNLLALAQNAIDLIRSSDLKIFNDPLPIVNKSIREMLAFVDKLTSGFDNVTDRIKALKTTLLATLNGDINTTAIDGIKEVLAGQDLVQFLPQDLVQKLFDSVDALSGAIQSLPDNITDALSFKVPTQLISSVAAFKGAITDLLNFTPTLSGQQLTDFNTARTQLSGFLTAVKDSVPAAQSALRFLFDALGVDQLVKKVDLQTTILPGLNQALSDLTTAAGGSPTAGQQSILNDLTTLRDTFQSLVGATDLDLVALLKNFDGLHQLILDAAAHFTTAQLSSLQSANTGFAENFPLRPRVAFDANKVLHVGFDFDLQKSLSTDLDFSAGADLLGFVPIDVTTGGQFTITVGGHLTLDFGMDIGNRNFVPFLFDTTQLSLTALVTATQLSAGVSIGGISAITLGPSPNFGSFIINSDGNINTTTPASLSINLVDSDSNPSDGHIQFGDLFRSIQFGHVGQLALSMPVKIGSTLLTAGNPAVVDPFTFTLGDLADFSTAHFHMPSFEALLNGVSLDLAQIINGLDAFLNLLADSLQSDLVAGLPLIGNGLTSFGASLDGFLAFVDQPGGLKDLLVGDGTPQFPGILNLTDPAQLRAAIQHALFDLLGPSGLNVLILDPTYDTVNTTTIDFDDVDVQVFVASGLNLLSDPDAAIEVRLHIGHDATNDTPTQVPFDLGFGGLGLGFTTTGGLDLTLGYQVDLGLRLDKRDGFSLLLNNDTTPEINLTAGVSLTPGTTLTANLFFLQLSATEHPNGDAGPTGFFGNVGVDISGPNNKVPFLQIGSLDLAPRIDLSAVVDLDLVASIAGNQDFPSIGAELFVLWEFDPLDGTGGQAPQVEIRNVTLDLGAFITKTIKPLLDNVNHFLEPIRPVLDVLTSEIPVISDLSELLGGPPVTFVSAISLLGDGGATVAKVIGILDSIADFVQDINQLGGGSLQINFGDISFGQDLRNTNPSQLDLSGLSGGFADFTGAMNSIGGTGDVSAARSVLSGAKDENTGLGISFPLLQNPSNIFKLLFGQTADLIVWDIPRLEADFSFSQTFGPLLPPIPLFARIAGSFNIFADFLVGFDTRGLKTHHFFDGFFIGDHDANGNDVPELGMTAEFTATAELNVVVASAGVTGGIHGEITANWHDPNNDGKVYFDELTANVLQGLCCVFDLHGAVTAFLEAFVKVGLDTPFGFVTLFDETFRLADVTLLEFNVECPPVPPPQLARVEGGVLKLNIGPDAGKRQPGATDVAETYSLKQTGAGKIEITAFGLTQTYTGVSSIYGNAGNGNDVITLDSSVTIAATLIGGPGDDQLKGGGGADNITGDEGNDQLSGGAGNDTMAGGAGDDLLIGGAGGDSLDGGLGNDNIQGGDNATPSAADGDDSITGGAGNDNLFGNGGNDTILGQAGNDNIRGGAGNDNLDGGIDADKVRGGAGADSVAGGGGDDILSGTDDDVAPNQDGNDTVTGGAGNDTMEDNEGDDQLTGGEGNDFIKGGLGNDSITGGDGLDTIEGGAGNDTILGGAGNDSLSGGADNDSIVGGTGNDKIGGGAGDDRLIGDSTDSVSGAAGNDSITGDEGADIILGDNGIIGSVTLLGGAGNDTLKGGAGADLIYGQGGADLVEGGADNDTLYGNLGNDTVRGQEGDDYLEGGAGADTAQGGSGNDRVIGGAAVVEGADAGDSITGDDGDDILLGDDGTISAAGVVATNLTSGGGNDTVFGGIGNDLIFGGFGGDQLIGDAVGGTGNDLIVGDQGTANATTIEALTGNGGAADSISGSGGSDTVLGGDGADTIAGDDGADILLGDNGQVTRSGVVVTAITASTSSGGGNDTISGSTGNDTVLGGDGADSITGAQGNDVLLGDNGSVTLSGGVVTQVAAAASTSGGNDIISGSTGNDTVLGGDGADNISGEADNDVLVGDNGEVNLVSGVVVSIFSTSSATGAGDTITGSTGNDTALGGDGADNIAGEDGNDVLVGDNGSVTLTAGQVTQVASTTSATGGNDTITGSIGNDTALGGDGADNIAGEDGNDVLLGDNGSVTLTAGQVTQVAATTSVTGGNDTITGSIGNDTALGGDGADNISGDAGQDVLLGDNGQVNLSGGAVVNVHTTDPSSGGNDTITGAAANDVILGGAGADSVAGDDGDDVLLGDNGLVEFAGGFLKQVASTDAGTGLNDIITASIGNDTALGGDGADNIAGADGNDILLGDNGAVDLGGGIVISIASTDAAIGGNDILVGSTGADTAFGGAGDDQISGDDGADVLIGDNGQMTFSAGVVTFIATSSPSVGGADTITGSTGNDTAFGGSGADSITGDTGADVLFGDNGQVQFGSGVVTLIASIDPAAGGNDTITGADGNDTALGGAADDVITGDANDDVVLGDNGQIVLSGGAVISIASTDPANGGNDTVRGNDGNDTVMGGSGNDSVTGDTGNDVLLGDNGQVLISSGVVTQIATTFGATGGNDTVSGADGNDTALGGNSADNITGAAGNDVLLGDHGEVNLSGGVVVSISSTDAANGGNDTIVGDIGNDTAIGGAGADQIAGDAGADVLLGDNGQIVLSGGTVVSIATSAGGVGGNDTVTASDGADTVLGGAGNDSITGDTGDDVVLGDNGQVLYSSGVVTSIATSDAGTGGNDTISLADGNDIALGGDGADNISGAVGNDIMVGDNGQVTFTAGQVTTIASTDPTVGGADTVTGAEGSDIIIGGAGGDNIAGGDGVDVIVGDNGRVDVAAGVVTQITTTDPAAGGNDAITGGAGSDMMLGGAGNDSMAGNGGDDFVIGDNGFMVLSGGVVTIMQTTDPASGGADVITGDDGNDMILGGTAGDSIDGGAGRDVILGDHGRLAFPGTSDPRVRVLAGTTLYDASGAAAVTATAQPNPAGNPPVITLFDRSTDAPVDSTFGNDTVAGGNDKDIVFGQLGDDLLRGDGSVASPVSANPATDGDDYVEGNGGNDVIHGGRGQDDLIGGSSSLFGLGVASKRPDGSDVIYGGDGTAATRNHLGDSGSTSHAADADTILGDNGNIFRIVGINGVNGGAFVTFNYDNYGSLKIIPRVVQLLDYTPGTDTATTGDELHGEAGDDQMYGQAGHDTMFGDGQDDDMHGGAGSDWMSGGTGSDGILGDDGRVYTSRNGTAEPLHGVAATTQSSIATPGNKLTATLNPTGQLRKTVDLEPFEQGGNDTMYGGLGNDSMHGGAGDDGVSGAEALPEFFSNPASTPAIVFVTATGNFAAFSDATPLIKIAGHPLNFEAGTAAAKVLDGQDMLFGDNGNDWVVGGTEADHIYVGRGNDIANADDNLETNGGANNQPDPAPFADSDTVYGGGGRDTLIGGSQSDRLVDWTGEFNAYIVPFSSFGSDAVYRSHSPQFEQFLYDLSKADGADQTRVGPGLGTAARNGEPFGELGLFVQQDADYQAQTTGSPADPQAGNTPGGQALSMSGMVTLGAEVSGPKNVAWADVPGQGATATVFVGNGFSAEQVARLHDALIELNQTWEGSTGVRLVETTNAATANIVIHFGTTTPVGGLTDGVLGFFAYSFYVTERGYFTDGEKVYKFAGQAEVTLIVGWDWYAGASESVPAGMIDFQTVVAHELGHALGLNHSANAGSVMFASLAAGVARRDLSAGDLQVLRYLYAGGPAPDAASDEGVHSGALMIDRSEMGHAEVRRATAVPPLESQPLLSLAVAPTAPVVAPSATVPSAVPVGPAVLTGNAPAHALSDGFSFGIVRPSGTGPVNTDVESEPADAGTMGDGAVTPVEPADATTTGDEAWLAASDACFTEDAWAHDELNVDMTGILSSVPANGEALAGALAAAAVLFTREPKRVTNDRRQPVGR